MADNLAFEKDDELKENVEQDVEKNDGYESVKGGTKIDDLEFGQMSPEQNGKPLEVKEEHDGPYAGKWTFSCSGQGLDLVVGVRWAYTVPPWGK